MLNLYKLNLNQPYL